MHEDRIPAAGRYGRPARARRPKDQSAKPALPGSRATLSDPAQTVLSRDQHDFENYSSCLLLTVHRVMSHFNRSLFIGCAISARIRRDQPQAAFSAIIKQDYAQLSKHQAPSASIRPGHSSPVVRTIAAGYTMLGGQPGSLQPGGAGRAQPRHSRRSPGGSAPSR
jgi:hypothetical protein